MLFVVSLHAEKIISLDPEWKEVQGAEWVPQVNKGPLPK
jgi:hypothetical protein